MFSVVNLEQGTQAWLEFRRQHVTATDACKIMGTVPVSWGTAYTCWCDKLSGKEIQINAAMQRGIELEPFARTAYNQLKGYDCEPIIALSNDCPWMMASLDGISSDLKHIVEIKCPGSKTHDIAKSGKIPDYYNPQLQHQMSVTGLNSVDYCSYDGTECVVINVDRDDEYIDEMIEKEKVFYDCIMSCDPPPSSEIYYEMVEDSAVISSANRLHNAKNKMKELDSIVKEEKAFLSFFAQGRNIKVADMKITQRFRKGNIKYSDIPELKQIDLEKYRSVGSEYYQFT